MTRKKYDRDTYFDTSSNTSSSDSEEEIEELTDEEMLKIERRIYDFLDEGKQGPLIFDAWNYREPHPKDMESWCYPPVIEVEGPMCWFVDLLDYESLKNLSRFARFRTPHVMSTVGRKGLSISVSEFKIILSYASKWLNMNGVYPDKINALWCMSRIIKSLV